jgi:MYXO-CTERM domain-containing protein
MVRALAILLIAAATTPALARECPIPECAAPPEGCNYQGPAALDEDGCPIGCGKLVCAQPCPIIDCAAPPPGCTYDGHATLDDNGCAASCGNLICGPPADEDGGGCRSAPGAPSPTAIGLTLLGLFALVRRRAAARR